MLSIITAIHNGLAVNKFFWKYLKQYTHQPFELIVVDNNSTDGSTAFYESVGARIIRNEKNYSYPVCQNQGIKVAKFDMLAFLNNDIVVAPGWDKRLLEVASSQQLEIVTPCGIERLENVENTNRLRRKWKAIKNIVSLFGIGETSLGLMHRLMYGNWENFCADRLKNFGMSAGEGFVGNTVLMKKSALDKVGLWDEQIQSADFDLYIRSKKRSLEHGDMKPMHIAWGVYHHHFIRLTVNASKTEFADQANMISLEEKWGQQRDLYLKDIEV